MISKTEILLLAIEALDAKIKEYIARLHSGEVWEEVLYAELLTEARQKREKLYDLYLIEMGVKDADD